MTAAEAREQRAKAIARKRQDEAMCSLDFLTWGDELGSHAKRCVYRGTATPTCSREYNPGPVPDEKMYEGTGIGTLFGLGTINAWQLAGWNITRRKEAE